MMRGFRGTFLKKSPLNFPKNFEKRYDYENESFRGYVGEYTSEGKVLSFWGSFCALSDYEYLVENYFDCKLKNDPDDL